MKTIRWRFRKRTIPGILIVVSLLALIILYLSASTFRDFHENALMAGRNDENPQKSEKEVEENGQRNENESFPRIDRWFDDIGERRKGEMEGTATDKGRIDPTVLADLLPHLRRRSGHRRREGLHDLNARVLLRAGNVLRSPPELLLMIPTTYRKQGNYLIGTLQNLLKNMFDGERHLAQIVVMLSDNPWEKDSNETLNQTLSEIRQNFAGEIGEGLIEVISPPSKWFPPDLDHIQPTLGDPIERMRWRAKQSLDYAFAMYHTRVQRPAVRFYVQLEDDIITVPGFLSEIHRFAATHPNFYMCEFSNLGFIGRMFHNGEDLIHLSHFILLLYRSLPVDWILSNVLNAKFCSLDETWKDCVEKRLNDVLFRRNPPLFQHIGRHSSLPGKIQNLTEKHFNRNKSIAPLNGENPKVGKIRSELEGIGSGEWHSFYEKYTPIRMNLTEPIMEEDVEKDGKLVEFDYSAQPLATLKALRIFFIAQFSTAPNSVPLPTSLLRVKLRHSPANNTIFADFTFPVSSAQSSPALHDHFLIIAEPVFMQIRSFQIALVGGKWRTNLRSFTLTELRILT